MASSSSNQQHRCALKGMVEVYKKIHDDLTQGHLDLLNKTPFGLLFKALYEERICKKNRNDNVLDQIILSYNPKQKNFKIGKKFAKLHQSEIQLFFGIKDGKQRVDNKKCSLTQTAFTERNFQGVQKLTAKMIKDKIIEIVKKEDEDSVQDTVRLLCLLLFQNCFFSTTGQVIAWTYVKYVDDLSKLNSYDWTYIIHKNLIESLDQKSKTPQTVNGCTLALWYWFCEHCKSVEPKEDEVAKANTNDSKYKGIPRATKWVLSDLNDVFGETKLSNFKEDQFIWNELKPTKAELELMPKIPEEHDGTDFEEPLNTKKRTNAAESSHKKKTKRTPKDKLSGKSKSQEKEDGDDSHLTKKKKRVNAVESSLRKKRKNIAQNDEHQKMKEVLNQQQEKEITQETPPQENVDSARQENEIPREQVFFDVPPLQTQPKDPPENVLQEVLNEYSPGKENEQWSDADEEYNQVVIDTPEALKVNLKVKDLPTEMEQTFETWEKREETEKIETETTESILELDQSTQTYLDPSEEDMKRREVDVQVLKAQIKALDLENKRLMKKMKESKDKEKESNELAVRVTQDFEKMEHKVVTLHNANARLEKHIQKKQEEMKILQVKLKETEEIGEQIQQEMTRRMRNMDEERTNVQAQIACLNDEIEVLRVENVELVKSVRCKEAQITQLQERMKRLEEEKWKSESCLSDLKATNMT